MNPVRHIASTNELRFARPREHVFEAFLDTQKWFQVSYGEERLKRVVNDRRVGGQIYEDWGDGTRQALRHHLLVGFALGLLDQERHARRRDHTQQPLRVRGAWIERGEVIPPPPED
jgi:hypothetical protein